jgi:hypothetical protein
MKYYHGSLALIDNKTILFVPDNKVARSSYVDCDNVKNIESLFERFKPKNSISRHDAIFLSDSAEDIDNLGGYNDYIYEVIPNGFVEKSDLSWYTMVSGEANDSDNPDEMKEGSIIKMINNYWAGIPSESPCFEYRCYSAIVFSEIDSLNLACQKKNTRKKKLFI